MVSNIWFHWNMNGEEILEEARRLVQKSISNNRKLLKLDITVKNHRDDFISLLADDMTEFSTFHNMCSFLQYVTPDSKIRKSCTQADQRLTNYIDGLNQDVTIYEKIFQFWKLSHREKELDDDDVHFLKKLIEGYERNGIKLSKTNRDVLKRINREIVDIEVALTNYSNKMVDNSVEFTEHDLTGVPSVIKKNFSIVGDNPIKRQVPLDRHQYLQCTRYATNEQVRQKLEGCYISQFQSVADEVARLLVLRRKKAEILSYESHSHLRTSTMMAKSPEDVKEFLTTILDKLDRRYDQELHTLKKLKKIDAKRGFAHNYKQINTWDISYLFTKWKKEYGLNENRIREYFPLPHVLKVIIRLYEEIFHLKFERVNNKLIWHQDVVTYNVHDQKTGSLLGNVYLDLHYREGKYGDIRCFGLQLPCMYPINLKKYQIPMVALVAPFRNNLLLHGEVVGLLHEFAHVIHFMLGKTKYSLFSGTNVELDFVEMPAQVMDSLAWNPEILRKLSSHYQTKSQLPEQIIGKMVNIRDLNIGIHYKKHILLSIFDQIIHSSSKLLDKCEAILTNRDQDDKEKRKKLIFLLTDLYRQLHQQIMPGVNLDDKNYFPVEWLSMLVGNDGRYYSSIWSKVYAAEIINNRVLSGFVDPHMGSDMHHHILRHGGNRDSYTSLKEFLGGNPTIDGFFEYYRLETDVEQSYFFTSERFKTENIETEVTESEKLNYFTEQGATETDGAIHYIKEKLKKDPEDYVTDSCNTSARYSNIFIKN